MLSSLPVMQSIHTLDPQICQKLLDNFWTNCWNSRALMRSSVLFWYWQILWRTTVPGLLLLFQDITPRFGLTLFTSNTVFCFIFMKILDSFWVMETLSFPPKYACLCRMKVLILVDLAVKLKYLGILVSVNVSEMTGGVGAPKVWVVTDSDRKEVYLWKKRVRRIYKHLTPELREKL